MVLRPSNGAPEPRTPSSSGTFLRKVWPTLDPAAQVADECRRPLGLLRDESLRAVALWKMEGYTHEEIAAKLGCVRFTVDRKLRAIRRIWDGERGQ
jgi:DNA-directed RNA polymerase specialized sigma24 family protein